jgi:colanic acid/amylovoran biosynthesis glycosyltransferase
LRIAFFTDRFPVLSETFVLSQITGLIDRGHEVDIFPRRSGGDLALQPDVERYGLLERVREPPPAAGRALVSFFGRARRVGRRNLGQLGRALNMFSFGSEATSLRLLHWTDLLKGHCIYDAILCHGGNNARSPMYLRSVGCLRGPLVTVFHGWDLAVYPRLNGQRVYHRLFHAGELFLPVSDYWKHKLVEMGCPENRTQVHRMGVDPGRFVFQPRVLPESGPVRILSVARLVEKKGLEFGIRAVARLTAQGRIPDISYTIIGDGPLKPTLEKLIRDLRLQNTVELVGAFPQQEVLKRLHSAHLLLAPSVTAADGDQEGIPMVLMEAMATGLPVVSTQHTGIPELVQDGISGCLVPERDVDALEYALGRLLMRPYSWAGLGEAGRRRVLALHHIHLLNHRLAELLSQIE